MDLKDIMAKIRAAVGEELTPKIDGLLKSIESEFNGVAEDLKAANAESKERKLKIRELTGQLDEISEKTKDLEGKVNNPEAQAELTALRTFKSEALKQRRGTFSSEFADVAKHANFEKAKEQFKLPKPAEDGSYDLSKLSDADVDHNMAKLAEYKAIGFFATETEPNAAAFNTPRHAGNQQTASAPRTPEELQQHIAQGLARYK